MTQPTGRYLSFDSVADDYDNTRVIPAPVRMEIARLCAREAGITKGGGLFFDAGVGTGRFALPLAKLYPGQVVGADVSQLMMNRLRENAQGAAPHLVRADLQRLPFPDGAFQGALVVHILHLIERWPLVLNELRRILSHPQGALLLGIEQGGRSVITDYYLERARVRGLLAPAIGTPGLAQAVGYLRRQQAHVAQTPTSSLTWKRKVSVQETLEALSRRAYSQMWPIPETDHLAVMAEAEEYVLRTYKSMQATETLNGRFILYRAHWLK